MATWDAVPVSTYDNGDGWTQESGSSTVDIWQYVDEGIGTENAGIKSISTSSDMDITFRIGTTPADLADASVTNIQVQIRYRQTGRSDDNLDWIISLFDGSRDPDINNDTAIASAASSDDWGDRDGQLIVDNFTNTTYANSALTTFTTLGLAGAGASSITKAQLDGAYLLIIADHGAVMGSESIVKYIDSIIIRVTYTPTVLSRAGQWSKLRQKNRPAIPSSSRSISGQLR